jgi:hypothetical protein
MKVKELIKLLKKEDPERLVVLSKDAEGNGFSPLDELETRGYIAECTWCGETVDEDRYIGEDCEPCLILWPIN